MSDASSINNLGPLASLIGTWEGSKGDDIAPSDDRGTENNKYREVYKFEDIGGVDNHEQKMFGLRYFKMAWRIGEDNPFHEEVGYYLYEPKTKNVMRCFIVPRGISVIAGGKVNPGDKKIEIMAEYGSQIYGICNNPFLDQEFRTVKFEMTLEFVDANTITYQDLTHLKIKNQDRIFMHKDTNTMKRKI